MKFTVEFNMDSQEYEVFFTNDDNKTVSKTSVPYRESPNPSALISWVNKCLEKENG